MSLPKVDIGPIAAFVPSSATIGIWVGRSARVGDVLKRWVAGEGWPFELLRLNDHLLADVGIARADLEDAALLWLSKPPVFSGDRAAQPKLRESPTDDQSRFVTPRNHANTIPSGTLALGTDIAGPTTSGTAWRMPVISNLLAALAMATFACSAFADTAPPMTGMPRLAIGGYDTVAYFTDGKAVPGSLDYQTIWHDARWQFASKEHLDLFKANPEKYAAQYDGHCAMGVAYESGHKDTVDPEAFTIVGGKLYVNHTKYWTTEWRKNEQENISQADKNWTTVKESPEPTK